MVVNDDLSTISQFMLEVNHHGQPPLPTIAHDDLRWLMVIDNDENDKSKTVFNG